MTAEVFNFPHNEKHVILALIKTAKRLEKNSAEQCIEVQRDIINLLMQECNRSSQKARVVLRALKILSDS